jgi:hypothetical protein
MICELVSNDELLALTRGHHLERQINRRILFISVIAKMKVTSKQRNNIIELAVWQLVAIFVAAFACLCTLIPLIARYRSYRCEISFPIDASSLAVFDKEHPVLIEHHSRHARQVIAPDQCGIIPPMCLPTTVVSTLSSTRPTTTQRTTVSTVSMTRPVITAPSTSSPTTTSNPWINTSRPYNSWRLPTFAVPTEYTLRLSCPICFQLKSTSSMIPFNGQAIIRLNLLSSTNYLVLHANQLNITRATVTNGDSAIAAITYLPEFEMVHLNFSPVSLNKGEIVIEIDYTGQINQHDQTGFYREVFWTANDQLS